MTKDSVGAVKAGELLSGQVKIKSDKTQVFQNGSVTAIGVARIFNLARGGGEGLKFNKSYSTAGTGPENFGGRDADLN